MNERFQLVDALFKEAARLPVAERAAFLERRCAGDATLRDEVLALLGEDQASSGPLDRPVLGEGVDLAGVAAEAADVAHLPERVGRYRPSRCIGQGGMGVVYEAEQDNPRRTVALKVINAGVAHPNLLRRFEHEAHVLGKLQHPGIAQIFEAGTFDGGAGVQPYFAMEFIDGATLTEFVNAEDFSSRQRLAMLASVCDAVEHAHQRGVIHRDLKPGNILVDSAGQPKVLDFGVARATDSDLQTTTLRTNIGQLIGTVPYMSPEQAAGDPSLLDTRSDVYALGVLGYEMLTGRLPYEVHHKLVHEAVRIIREDDPTPLSSINRFFSGDIETIIGRALEKDKDRRYQSAADLSADIRRYLNDEPITARPPSGWYKIRKFAKRNTAFVAGTVGVLLALVAGLVVSLTLLVRARDAEFDASRKAATAEQVADALSDLFSLTSLFDVDDPSVAGSRTVTAREILDNGRRRVTTELADQPEVLATLLDTIGRAYLSLGDYGESRPLMEQALALRRELHEPPHEDIADSLDGLGLAAHMNHDYADARALHEEAMQMRLELFGPEHVAVAESLDELGRVLHATGDYDGAEQHLRRALAMRRRLVPDDDVVISDSQNNLASLLTERGEHDEAERLYRDALVRIRRVYGNHNPEVATTLGNLGFLLRDRGELDEAESKLREAIALRRELLGDDHPMIANSLNSLARLQRKLGRTEEAVAMHREALAIQRATLTPDHSSIATTLSNLARAMRANGEDAAATEAIYRESLEMLVRTDPDNPNVPTVMHNLAIELRDGGNLEEASRLFLESAERNTVVRGPDDERVLIDLGLHASVEMELGRPAVAEPVFREMIARQRLRLGDHHRYTVDARCRLGTCLVRLGRFEEAETLLVESYEVLAADPAAGADRVDETIARIIALYEAWERPNAARPWRELRGE
jgi:serine/threonine protein kinase/Flp pilus assembly protein TadD